MAKVKVEEQKVQAVLTIKDASDPAVRKAIAAWLRDQAKSLVHQGWKYAPRFRARYLTPLE